MSIISSFRRDVESPEKPLNKSYTFGACAVPLQCLTVGDALDAAAIKKPDQVIYIFSQTDETWTFIDLLAKVGSYQRNQANDAKFCILPTKVDLAIGVRNCE